MNEATIMTSNTHPKSDLMPEEVVIIRSVDPAKAALELSARAAEIDDFIRSLDETKIVTQETLQIEFSV